MGLIEEIQRQSQPPDDDGSLLGTIRQSFQNGNQWLDEQIRYYGGPHVYNTLAKTGQLINFLSPVNDVHDAIQGSQRLSRGVVDGDWWDAATGAAQMGGALGTLAMVGALTAPKRAVSNYSASVSDEIYDPPQLPPRPFKEDYPNGDPNWIQGERLGVDIEGRPLTARHVVGRNEVSRGERPLAPQALDEIAQATTGEGITYVPQSSFGRGVVGRTKRNRRSDTPEEISVLRDLPSDQRLRVSQHEVAHAIDVLVGTIPTNGIKRELAKIYHDLNDSTWRRGKETRPGLMTRPQDRGYRGVEVDEEWIAEAIRAYMADPNYIKSVAPKTAKRIREAVNKHPVLSKVVQFNAVGGVVATGALDSEK